MCWPTGCPLAPTTLTDGGENSPSRYDGTGSFSRRSGGAVLVLNHENGTTAVFPVPHRERLTYDAGAAWGGTTTLSVDRNGHRVSEVVSLAGTISNCAGGVTPWNTWLSCEETEIKAGQSGALKDHGYVFEVDPYELKRNADPQPIKAFGRFPPRGHCRRSELGPDVQHRGRRLAERPALPLDPGPSRPRAGLPGPCPDGGHA